MSISSYPCWMNGPWSCKASEGSMQRASNQMVTLSKLQAWNFDRMVGSWWTMACMEELRLKNFNSKIYDRPCNMCVCELHLDKGLSAWAHKNLRLSFYSWACMHVRHHRWKHWVWWTGWPVVAMQQDGLSGHTHVSLHSRVCCHNERDYSCSRSQSHGSPRL